MIAIFKFAKIGYFSEFIFFLSYFPIRRKVSKGTTKGKRDCDLPLSFGNLSPSNACFCYHSGQSAASQTCSAPLAEIVKHLFCNTRENYVRKTASLLMRACFGVPFRLTTVFLSSFWFIFLLSFSKEGRKTNVEKIV